MFIAPFWGISTTTIWVAGIFVFVAYGIVQYTNFKDGKRNGLRTKWYRNGQKKEEENYKDGKMDGLSTLWYENGQKEAEGNYKDGKLMTAVVWKPNGEKCPVTNVVEGNGIWVNYNYNEPARRRIYKDGELVKSETYKDGISVRN